MGIDLITLMVLFGASARLWHLGATDKLSLPLREHAHERITQWLECHRCGGYWWALAVPVLYAFSLAGPTWVERAVFVVLLSLASNWAFVASRETLAKLLKAYEDRTAALAGPARAAAERSEWPA